MNGWVNPPGVYYSAGMDAGRAMRNGDAARVKHLLWWRTQSRALERAENRPEVDAQWAAGYAITNPSPRFEPFT